MNPDSVLPPGVYETPLTQRVRERIETTAALRPAAGINITDIDRGLEPSRHAAAISAHIAQLLEKRLAELDSTAERVALINQLASHLGSDEKIEAEALLYAITDSALADPPLLPQASLHKSALFTNAAGDTNMSVEIGREIATADSVDLLCAFVRNSGISAIQDELEYLRDHQIPLRVLTSTYCGATQATALDRLVKQFGAHVRISYETKSTRLHAKAWLFRRNSGFDTAFIGSSNLSRSALVDGWEWNVRGSSTATPEIISKFIKTFDSYWHEGRFLPFEPARDSARLKRALDTARFGAHSASPGAAGGADNLGEDRIQLSGLRVEPFPYQQEMLASLESERKVKGHHRNLLVAATGTGKTVVAALDYRNLATEAGRLPRLLFIAHRKEILELARRVFREVLSRSDFGELWFAGTSPRRFEHVFASIQSLHPDRLDKLARDHFEVVIVDEFHHAKARTYSRVMRHFQPQELLGLTATPERTDGTQVQEYFDFRIAHELRLWDALQFQLLSPMHYYGVTDGTDLSGLRFRRGSYDIDELEELYIKAGQRRVRFIISQIERRVFDLQDMKALGFCVSKAHAYYMAEQFSQLGIPARAITSDDNAAERAASIDALKAGTIKCLFSVDIFNEGVDIPPVNTLLLLRPTQSPVLFIQQLGRGLRLSPGKDVCVVLDFIGQQHADFNFEERYAALTRTRGRRLHKEIAGGFASAPPGSHISLDQELTTQVLRNIAQLSRTSRRRLTALVQQEGTTDLAVFLHDTHVPVEDIYRLKGSSWSGLLHDVGLRPRSSAPDNGIEDVLLGRLGSLLHINDQPRVQAYSLLIDPDGPYESDMDPTLKTYATMLLLALFSGSNLPGAVHGLPGSIDAGLDLIRQAKDFCWEFQQVMDYTFSSARVIPQPEEDSVLMTHAEYTLAEFIGALDSRPLAEFKRLPGEGVKYFPERDLDLFLVTFEKDDTFSQSTNYRDYPITPELMHWESQSRTALSSPTAQRYIHHRDVGSSIAMATRFRRTTSYRTTMPYTYLGKVDYISHKGEKPIQFEWKLHRPMPNNLYVQARTVA